MTQTHTHCKQVEPQKFNTRTRNWLAGIFVLALVASVALQFTFHAHSYFKWDGMYWFYPAFGLLCSVALVLVSKVLGWVLKRRDTYWEEKQ